MWNCPVCDRKNNTPFCPVCGFDPSADAEAVPTFAPLTGAVPSAAGLRRERSGLTLCPDCGGTAFCLEKDSGLARCRICGHALPIRPAKKAITAIAAGDAHTAVLYSDGTVRCVGKNNLGQCNTGAWRDIVAISAGFENTLGLRADGTLVSVGVNDGGQCSVDSLML